MTAEEFVGLYGPSDNIVTPMWAASVLYSSRNDEIARRFQEDTGCRYRPASSPLEAMIDDATGMNERLAAQFVRWHNRYIWGETRDGRACNGNEDIVDLWPFGEASKALEVDG